MSNVAVVARLSAQPGKRDDLVAALQAALDNAESEPGTRYYILHTDDKDADAVWFYELYGSAEDLKAHSTSDAFKALGPTLASLLAGRPELTFLTPVGGKGL